MRHLSEEQVQLNIPLSILSPLLFERLFVYTDLLICLCVSVRIEIERSYESIIKIIDIKIK